MAPVTADGGNHISSFTPDASGNTVNDGTYSYTWNAEAQFTSGGGVNFAEDFLGSSRVIVQSNGVLPMPPPSRASRPIAEKVARQCTLLWPEIILSKVPAYHIANR
jgi:hypothetical protein